MDISIIGGGITGLTTAIALQKVGLSSHVYEQASDINEIGAGIWLQPNAIKILNFLDLKEEIQHEGWLLNKMEITNHKLKPIKKINQEVVSDADGNQTIAIHRGKLQKILIDKFTQNGRLKLGMQYQNHQFENEQLSIRFENQSLKTDILLGADGIKSKVRANLGFPSTYRNTNQICCRGVANYTLPKELINEGKEMWGNKLRFGFSQISDKQVYFFAVVNQEISPKNLDLNSLSFLFKPFHPIVLELINHTENIHISELTDLKRLPKWYQSSICLLGDAAHATTPNMGQGACQGIEDAYYLSLQLKNMTTSVEPAFQQFEQKRRKKVDSIVNNSWSFGKMAHHPIGQIFMKGLMKCTPSSVISKQMNTIFQIEGL